MWKGTHDEGHRSARVRRPQEVLELAEVPTPTVGDQDVLVRVRASSANPWDWHFIRGEPVLCDRRESAVSENRSSSSPGVTLQELSREWAMA